MQGNESKEKHKGERRKEIDIVINVKGYDRQSASGDQNINEGMEARQQQNKTMKAN